MYTDEELVNLVKSCKSQSDLCRIMNWPINGTGLRKAKNLVVELGLNPDELFAKRHSRPKYQIITVQCPVCSKPFDVKKGHPKQKVTCSYACSNKHFRSGRNNGNFKEDHELTDAVAYHKICFRHHEKKCCVCGEDRIVEAHHYDENHLNNDPSNFVPLCPTHHRYVHSRYKHLVIDVVDKYVADFKESNRYSIKKD